jgi:hypothetical protein
MPHDPSLRPDAVASTVYEFDLYRLDQVGSTLSSLSAMPFDSGDYSRYKYGSVSAADAYAHMLWSAFLPRNERLARLPRLLVAASPYRHVPTAANEVAVRFAALLSAERGKHGLSAARVVRIERMSVPSGDYGTLPVAARTRLMADNALSFDTLRPYADDAHLIIVDDVKVTGAHQRCLLRASDSLPLRSRTFVHIAAFDPGNAQLDPGIEDTLNHAAVRTLGDLADIAEASDFTWNVRVCKFLLNPANRAELASFLARMPRWFVEELCHHSVADGYARMEPYRESYGLAVSELNHRDQPSGAR